VCKNEASFDSFYVSFILGGGRKMSLRASLNIADFLASSYDSRISQRSRIAAPRHQTHDSTLLPGSPALLECPKSARMSPPGIPAPPAHCLPGSLSSKEKGNINAKPAKHTLLNFTYEDDLKFKISFMRASPIS
jgi:hypothetical protein